MATKPLSFALAVMASAVLCLSASPAEAQRSNAADAAANRRAAEAAAANRRAADAARRNAADAARRNAADAARKSAADAARKSAADAAKKSAADVARKSAADVARKKAADGVGKKMTDAEKKTAAETARKNMTQAASRRVDPKELDKQRTRVIGGLDNKRRSDLEERFKKNQKAALDARKPAGLSLAGGSQPRTRLLSSKGGTPVGASLTAYTPGDMSRLEGLRSTGDSGVSGFADHVLNSQPLTDADRAIAQTIINQPARYSPWVRATVQKALDRDRELSATLVSLGGSGVAPGGLPGGVPGGVPGVVPGGVPSVGSIAGGSPGMMIVSGVLQIIDSATGGALGIPQGMLGGSGGVLIPTPSDGGGAAEVDLGSVQGVITSIGTDADQDSSPATGDLADADDSDSDKEAPPDDDGSAASTDGVAESAGSHDLEATVALDDGQGGQEAVPVTAVSHSTRRLRIGNASKEKATVYVQYYALDKNGEWRWSPADPSKAKDGDAMAFEVGPGDAVDVFDGDWQIAASKARIWAVMADSKRELSKFKDQDLILVPERDESGTPCYVAKQIGTYRFTVK